MLITANGMEEDNLSTSMCSNQVEAEVIVHSELLDTGREKEEEGYENSDSNTTLGPSLSEEKYSPLSQPSPQEEEEPLEKLSLSQSSSNLPSVKLVATCNGEIEDTGHQLTADTAPHQEMGLTNGFHSPKIVLRSEHLENGDSRHCPSAAGKAMSPGLSPSPFVSTGLVHSTSAAHSYLCP